MKKFVCTVLLAALALPLAAQADRHELRAGNRKYARGKWAEAELDYRKGLLRDSLSVPGAYNLASALYRQEDFDGALKAFENRDECAEATPYAAAWYYNKGDAAIAKKDWRTAVDALRECLLLTPGDMDAKENYLYAKEMLKNEQQQGGGGQDQQNQQQQNQDQQNQDQQNQNQQNQDQQQQQQQQQDQDENQDQQGQQDQEQQMTPQQARQLLRAVQAKEQETQEKVKKEKAALLKSRQKDKNW